jgi:hypothetical protein
MDWAAWSRESVALMSRRTTELLRRHAVPEGCACRWDLDAGRLDIGGVSFLLVTVGTVSGDSFLWAWANDAIPAAARRGLDAVRAFGAEHQLSLLTGPGFGGGLAQLKECVAISGRVLNAAGVWIDRTETGHIAFVLFEPSPS